MTSSKDKRLINSNIQFCMDDALIIDVVKMMVDQKISSVLIHNKDQEIIGIITERDIVRKFTLLDMNDKLERKVTTLMTRGVQFVNIENMVEEIVKLHIEKNIRHFPVLMGKEPVMANVAGIVSITDFLKRYIINGHGPNSAHEPHPQIPLGLYYGPANLAGKQYLRIFSNLGFSTHIISDVNEFLRTGMTKPIPLIFDMDGFSENAMKENLKAIIKYPGPTIFATSNPNTVALFRKHLRLEKHSVALKPLDFSYCQWFITRNYKPLPNK